MLTLFYLNERNGKPTLEWKVISASGLRYKFWVAGLGADGTFTSLGALNTHYFIFFL